MFTDVVEVRSSIRMGSSVGRRLQDEANIYTNQSPVVEVTITSPTQLVTTDSPDTPLDVV